METLRKLVKDCREACLQTWLYTNNVITKIAMLRRRLILIEEI